MLNHPPSLSQYHSSGVDVYHDLSAHNQNCSRAFLHEHCCHIFKQCERPLKFELVLRGEGEHPGFRERIKAFRGREREFLRGYALLLVETLETGRRKNHIEVGRPGTGDLETVGDAARQENERAGSSLPMLISAGTGYVPLQEDNRLG